MKMYMTAQEITGRRIKILRIQKGYSQTKLAEMVGYKDKTAISKIEAGEVDLPLSKIMAFSTVLSTDMYYLLGNISDMEEPQKNHDDLGVVEQERDMWKHTASVYENRYKEVKGLEYCQIAVSIVMLLISALLMLLSVMR